MDITITPKKLHGSIHVIPSKSQAHRVLICAAFANDTTKIYCKQTNRDIEATARCLCALGARIERDNDGYTVYPIEITPRTATLPCDESGSTLRFLLPIVGALGVDATFILDGRLSKRPLSPLWEEMERMGCRLSRPSEKELRCEGSLQNGQYHISGDVSSQFITGLLLALSLLKADSRITVTGKLESKPYVDLTQSVMEMFQVDTAGFHIKGNQTFKTPGKITIEGDWSNAAFFLAANAMDSQIDVQNLDDASVQGDRAVVTILKELEENVCISAMNIPDLVPILSVVAASKKGCMFTDIQRLRLKESDRVSTVIQMLEALGIRATSTESTLTVFPGKISGGLVDAANDHRIAMSAAIAATIASGPVTISGANCVEKSYPSFWEEYVKLGGSYE